MRVRQLVIAVVASLGATACLTPTDPANVPVGAVRVTLGDRALTLDTLGVRRTARVNATAIAREGYELPITSFHYASSDSTIASVDSSGVVLALTPGTAHIAATAPDGTRGLATVVVVPSTVDYDIAVGGAPGAIVFSPDYTKAYVAVAGGSVAFLDAIGFFRLTTLALSDDIADLATTPSRLYATHPTANAVSVIATATRTVEARIALEGAPAAAASRGARVWIATPALHRIVVVEGTTVSSSFGVDGEPGKLALSADGSRLYVAVHVGDGWQLEVLDAGVGTVQGSVVLPGQPVGLGVGTRGGAEYVYALIPATNQLIELTVADGRPAIARASTAPQGAGGIAARDGATPLLIVSGSPLGILDANALRVIDSISGAGAGTVAVRPDGLFVFVGAPDRSAVRVIGL